LYRALRSCTVRYMPKNVHCRICREPLTWDDTEGAWVTPDGYDVCPTDRQEHDPYDENGIALPLYL